MLHYAAFNLGLLCQCTCLLVSRKKRVKLQDEPQHKILVLNIGDYIGAVKQIFERKNVIIFLPSNLNICFGCSKEPSH